MQRRLIYFLRVGESGKSLDCRLIVKAKHRIVKFLSSSTAFSTFSGKSSRICTQEVDPVPHPIGAEALLAEINTGSC